MKLLFAFTALIAFLTACSRSPDDAKIREKLIGTWVADWDPSVAVQNKPNGTFVITITRDLTNVLKAEGFWQVKGGTLTTTTTNASWPNAELKAEKGKVLSIDARKLVVQGAPGGQPEYAFHKK
jgi:hypothetical protein